MSFNLTAVDLEAWWASIQPYLAMGWLVLRILGIVLACMAAQLVFNFIGQQFN